MESHQDPRAPVPEISSNLVSVPAPVDPFNSPFKAGDVVTTTPEVVALDKTVTALSRSPGATTLYALTGPQFHPGGMRPSTSVRGFATYDDLLRQIRKLMLELTVREKPVETSTIVTAPDGTVTRKVVITQETPEIPLERVAAVRVKAVLLAVAKDLLTEKGKDERARMAHQRWSSWNPTGTEGKS